MTRQQILGGFLEEERKKGKKKRQAGNVSVAQGLEWERQERGKPIRRLFDYCNPQDKKRKIDESLNLAVIGNEKVRMNSRGIGVFGKAQ